MPNYTETFYKVQHNNRYQSAKEIIPLVLKLIQPKQVIDVGCGTGLWLSVFQEYGIEDIFGVDGDWVNPKMLQIPAEKFLSFDLKQPLQINRKFDLVMSVEVAEHLPSECADTFVNSLVQLGSVVLFSAAVPFQGGVGHVNEQWQDYWVEIFKNKGYVVIDCIRKQIWENHKVAWWYAQNILMFVKQDCLSNYPLLEKELENTDNSQLSIVHPRGYLRKSEPSRMSLNHTLSALPTIVKTVFNREINKLRFKK